MNERDRKQKKVIDITKKAYNDENSYIMWSMPTGFGKTHIISHMLIPEYLKEHPGNKVIVVSPTRHLRNELDSNPELQGKILVLESERDSMLPNFNLWKNGNVKKFEAERAEKEKYRDRMIDALYSELIADEKGKRRKEREAQKQELKNSFESVVDNLTLVYSSDANTRKQFQPYEQNFNIEFGKYSSEVKKLIQQYWKRLDGDKRTLISELYKGLKFEDPAVSVVIMTTKKAATALSPVDSRSVFNPASGAGSLTEKSLVIFDEVDQAKNIIQDTIIENSIKGDGVNLLRFVQNVYSQLCSSRNSDGHYNFSEDYGQHDRDYEKAVKYIRDEVFDRFGITTGTYIAPSSDMKSISSNSLRNVYGMMLTAGSSSALYRTRDSENKVCKRMHLDEEAQVLHMSSSGEIEIRAFVNGLIHSANQIFRLIRRMGTAYQENYLKKHTNAIFSADAGYRSACDSLNIPTDGSMMDFVLANLYCRKPRGKGKTIKVNSPYAQGISLIDIVRTQEQNSCMQLKAKLMAKMPEDSLCAAIEGADFTICSSATGELVSSGNFDFRAIDECLAADGFKEGYRMTDEEKKAIRTESNAHYNVLELPPKDCDRKGIEELIGAMNFRMLESDASFMGKDKVNDQHWHYLYGALYSIDALIRNDNAVGAVYATALPKKAKDDGLYSLDRIREYAEIIRKRYGDDEPLTIEKISAGEEYKMSPKNTQNGRYIFLTTMASHGIGTNDFYTRDGINYSIDQETIMSPTNLIADVRNSNDSETKLRFIADTWRTANEWDFDMRMELLPHVVHSFDFSDRPLDIMENGEFSPVSLSAAVNLIQTAGRMTRGYKIRNRLTVIYDGEFRRRYHLSSDSVSDAILTPLSQEIFAKMDAENAREFDRSADEVRFIRNSEKNCRRNCAIIYGATNSVYSGEPDINRIKRAKRLKQGCHQFFEKNAPRSDRKILDMLSFDGVLENSLRFRHRPGNSDEYIVDTRENLNASSVRPLSTNGVDDYTGIRELREVYKAVKGTGLGEDLLNFSTTPFASLRTLYPWTLDALKGEIGEFVFRRVLEASGFEVEDMPTDKYEGADMKIKGADVYFDVKNAGNPKTPADWLKRHAAILKKGTLYIVNVRPWSSNVNEYGYIPPVNESHVQTIDDVKIVKISYMTILNEDAENIIRIRKIADMIRAEIEAENEEEEKKEEL